MTETQKKTEFVGGNISAFAAQFLDPSIADKDIVRISVNPLIFGTVNTVTNMIFSEKFIINIVDMNKDIDEEKTELIRSNFKKIGLAQKTRVATNDSLLFGNGIDEFAWDQDPDTKYIMFSAMSRRPPENFAKKKENPASSSLRWKGIYYTEDGGKGFDEAVKTDKGTEVITLDPEQIMCIPSITEIAPDGPGFLEYLAPILQGAKYAWVKIFDVMDTQITPEDIITADTPDDVTIAKNYVEHHTSNDIVPRPESVKVEHTDYPNKKDVIEFFKFFQQYLLWVVLPTAALNYDGSNALLDSSSGKSKTDLLFSFIDTLRANIATELEKKVDLWIRLNGFEKQFAAQVLAPSTIPTAYEESVAVMTLLAKSGSVTMDEMREWANSFSGFDLPALETGGESFVAMAAEPDDQSKAKLDAMVTALLGDSFSKAADDLLMPLVKKIEKAGI